MQTATILLSLSGERDNQIPKYDVTPAEALLLRALHGDEAVTEIEVNEEGVDTTSRAERARLFNVYSRPNPRGGRLCPELDGLFPGAAARLPEKFEEVELDESFFKEPARKAAVKDADPLDHDEDGKKGGSKVKSSRKKKADAPAKDEAAETSEAATEETDDKNNLFE